MLSVEAMLIKSFRSTMTSDAARKTAEWLCSDSSGFSINSCKKMERRNCISRIYEVLANSEKTIEELFQKMNEEESVDMDDIRRGVNQGVEMGILGITGLVSK
ncbi:uncharacterized protein ACN427_000841 isoform 2-T2 [Glossina fuscipes fuscipes]